LGEALSALFSDRDLFEIWYRKDQNAVPPDYRLIESSISQLPESLERLGAEIRQAAPKLDLREEYRRLLLGSATEQEIASGLLDTDSSLGQTVIGLVRIIQTNSLLPIYQSSDQAARLNQERLIEWVTRSVPDILKEEIELVNGVLPADYLERICTFVIDTFQRNAYSTVQASETASLTDTEANALLVEQYASDLVIGERERSLLARIGTLDPAMPLAVIGPAGMGKTSLLSLIARERASNEKVIVRLIGVASPRPRLSDLLESIISEIAECIGEGYRPNPLPNPTAAASELERALRELASRQTATLIVDSLDELETPAALSADSWIPQTLPPNIRIIVASRPAPWLDENRIRQIIELEPMKDEDARLVLGEVLSRKQRQLQSHQTKAIINDSKGIPLLLRLNAIDAMRWADHHRAIPLTKSIELAGSDLLRLITVTLGHGERLALVTLGLLFTARHGLNEEEILGAYSFDAEILAEQSRRAPDAPVTDEVPYAVWSRLLVDLEPFISTQSTVGGPVWRLKHRSLMESLSLELEARGLSKHCSHLLAEYFSRQSWTIGTVGSPNARKLIEYPFHLVQCGRISEFWEVLINPFVLTATFEILGTPGLTGLLELAEGRLDKTRQTDLDVLRFVIEQIAPATMSNRAAFPSLLDEQLQNGLMAEPGLHAGLTKAHRPWLRQSSSSRSLRAGTFTDFGTKIGSVVTSADGRIIAGVGYEFVQVFIWDLLSGELISKIEDSRMPIGLSPDSRYCVTTCLEHGKIRVTEISTLATVTLIDAIVDDRDRRIAVTLDSVVIANGHEISLFSLHDGRLQSVLRSERKLLCAGASIDGQIIVGGCYDGSLAVFRNQRDVTYLEGDRDPIQMLTVSADGTHAVSASKKERLLYFDRNKIILWDLVNAEGQLLDNHLSSIRDVDISSDGSVAAWIGTFEESAYIYGQGATSDVREIGSHNSWVEGVAVSPDGKKVYTASRDATLQVTSVAQLPGLAREEGFEILEGGVTAIIQTPGEEDLLVTSYGRKRNFASVDPRSGRLRSFMNVHTEDVNDVSVAGGGTMIASVSDDGKLVVRTRNGEKLWVWRPRRGCIGCVDMTSDGNWGAVGFYTNDSVYITGIFTRHKPRGARTMRWRRADGELWLLNLKSHRCQQRTRIGKSGVTAVQFLDGDQLLATLGDTNNLSVWCFDKLSGKLSLLWTANDIEVIAGHTESGLFVTGTFPRGVRGYDAATGLVRWSYQTDNTVCSLALAPRAHRLLTIDVRGHVHLVDLKNRKSIASTIVIGASEACALSEDGQRAWIGCCTGEVKIFELKDYSAGPK